MKARKLLGLAVGFVLALSLATCLSAQNINLGLSISDGKVRSFYLSVSSYFGVPEARVVEIRQAYRLSDEELPVVFFIATRARVEPVAVINLRLKGMSWWDISLHYGLSPEVFFIQVGTVKIGPPYGRAYGFYNKYRERKTWGQVVLTDMDVVNLVNLKFIAEHHKIPPEKVMEMRGRGDKFLDIHDRIVKEKGKGGAVDNEKPKNKPGKKGKK